MKGDVIIKTAQFLKEWNATIEALGQGKQTILVRGQRTSVDKFFFYPTFNYSNRPRFLNSFQRKHESFVMENSFNPSKDRIIIKYFAKVEDIIERPYNGFKLPEKFFIWNRDHIKNYLKSRNPKIWILRVYELNEPFISDPVLGPLTFGKFSKEYSYEDVKPVLSDKEFNDIIEKI